MCGGVRSEAWAGTYGAVPGCPPEFAADAKLNVVWGNNATVTNLHLVRRIRQSKRKGGKLVVVDPLRTKIAEQADLHLAPLPEPTFCWHGRWRRNWSGWARSTTRSSPRTCSGSTSSWRRARLAGGTRGGGVRPARGADRLTFAQLLAEADPLVFAPGNGLERGRNGGSSIRALIALPALLGKLGNGSGIVLGASNAFPKTPGGCNGRTSRRRACAR